jgi:hypothetical protein
MVFTSFLQNRDWWSVKGQQGAILRGLCDICPANFEPEAPAR